ncbi:MAG: translation initiation factor IF-2 [Candidatus Cloacimonetes bacterium]|nr:translation initiation factor IF-2 [Candidatus Cloacimonadota bacterium]
MAKLRVFQLANELKYDQNKLITLCNEAGIGIKRPTSSVTEEIAQQIRDLVKKKSEVKPEAVPVQDGVIRSMKDLPSISSDDLEKGNAKLAKKPVETPEPKKVAAPVKVEKPKVGDAAKKVEQKKPAQVFHPSPEHKKSKKKAMTEFERQAAKITKRKQQKERQSARQQKRELEQAEQEEASKMLTLGDAVSVAEIANLMEIKPADLIAKLMSMGIMASINQRLDEDTLEIIAEEYGYSISEEEVETEIDFDFEDAEEDLSPREPVVTIMGHVDHGKTTLLDFIRKSAVTEGEAGGITQHIGAYKVKSLSGQSICFLDTPGHEAFTAMRAHGSQITDIAILVIAADDSVKPQTLEAINHAKNADVPIIVAVTKIDKQDIRLEKVYEDLGANGLIVEQWGGSVPCVGVSGISGEGVDDLLELVSIQAELMELKANANRDGVGIIIEAGLQKGKGACATVLVQKGTVHVGDIMVSGSTMGRVRAITDEHGKRKKTAGPSTPVEITGFSGTPQFADKFYIVANEKIARSAADRRKEQIKKAKDSGAGKVVSLETLFAKVEESKIRELKIIVKSDVHGSAIALSESLEKVKEEDVQVKVIHSAVGAVTESDVMLASAAEAIIICFHVRPDSKARQLADVEKVEIRTYQIIYKAIEDVEAAILGMLEPVYNEVILGKSVVREVFSIAKVGKVAGTFVEMGKIVKGKQARILRDSVQVYQGKIEGLNRFKEQVTEVLSGYECGINLKYNDIKPKDVIEVFEMQEIPRKTQRK